MRTYTASMSTSAASPSETSDELKIIFYDIVSIKRERKERQHKNWIIQYDLGDGAVGNHQSKKRVSAKPHRDLGEALENWMTFLLSEESISLLAWESASIESISIKYPEGEDFDEIYTVKIVRDPEDRDTASITIKNAGNRVLSERVVSEFQQLIFARKSAQLNLGLQSGDIMTATIGSSIN